jgi:hypothetical protein
MKMKNKFSLLVLSCLLAGMALQAQDVDITGTWTMYEMIWTTGDNVNTTTADQLKKEGMKSEYELMPEGKLKVVSNMTGSGNMENIEGTWKLEGDKLTFSLDLEGNLVDVVWDFEYRDEAIHLTRTSPDGATSVVNSFKRK